MDFHSPRFAGNALLEEILNDPNTGTKKLQDNSPYDAVLPVQQALADLGWPYRVIPPILTDPFADGDYGSGTAQTVLAYKRRYNIYYPPTAASGTIDEFVGPRTLWKLDIHIRFWDESVAAIDAKIAALQAEGVDIVADPVGGDVTQIVIGHAANMRFVIVEGAQGAVFNTQGIGAFEVHGSIFNTYMQQQDAFGMPTSDEYDGDDYTRQSDFELGTLRYDPKTGRVEPGDFYGQPKPQF